VTLFAVWIGGFPVLGVIAGILGVSFRRVRPVLIWPAAVYSAVVFVYGLFAGGPNGTAYVAGLNVMGVAVVVAVTVLSLATILSAKTNARVPSVVATIVLGVLILIFTVGLAPWVPAASCVLAAAIAGPPGKLRGSPAGSPSELG
jgi:fumarate reductase subunit C